MVSASAVSSNSIAQVYDTHLKQEPLSCRKGCANCCYHPVLVTLLEGLRIFRHLELSGQWTVKLRTSLTEHATKTLGLAVEVWHLGMIPCPFLSEEKHCEIYSARPFSCAVTYSLGDPNDCHPQNLGNGLLPKRELFEMQAAIDKPLLEKLHLPHFRAPLSITLLYAEKISQGSLDASEFRKALWTLP